MFTLEELCAEVVITLRTLRIQFKKVIVVKDVSAQFVCDDFGVLISAINRDDYTFIRDAVVAKYPDYRYVFVSTNDNLIDSKDEIVWSLMQSGFMRFVRTHYPRQFHNFIREGFGLKIINERLKRWAGKPKYKFLIAENEKAKNIPSNILITDDPAFFDYMP